jgi:hypothetical protein
MGTFLLDDLADLLSTGGVTTQIYRGFMPEKPDEAVQLVETGGIGPVHAMASAPGLAVEERASVQIVRRSATYQRARASMNVIFRLLDGAGDRTVNGTRYLWIEAIQSPFALGQDETGRTLVACNFNVCKALSTSTST